MLDAEVADLLSRFQAEGARPYEQLGVLRARRMVEGATRLQGERADVVEVRDLLIPGPAGELPARLYRPARAAEPPLIVYFHGGGWVLGSVATADRPCRDLAVASGCIVVSVEYRRAPETKFPGPVEDCFAATSWLAAEATDLGADPAKVVVMGDSAGGNLAAAVALMALDRGGPLLAAQVLLYPCLAPARQSRFASYRENGEGYSLTRGSLEWFWDLYLTSAADGDKPYAAPLAAPNLAGLPPSIVVTAGYDPLRDEGRAYVDRLAEARVPVKHLQYPGAIHGIFWMAGVLSVGRLLVSDVARHLNELLSSEMAYVSGDQTPAIEVSGP